MEKFGKVVLRFRLPVIFLSLALTLFFLFQLRKIRIESDFAKYLRQDAPEVVTFNYIGEKFGGNELILVAIRTDSLFSRQVLKLISKLTEEYRTVKGVSSVTSLTNIIDIKKSEDGIEVTKLLREVPEDTITLRKFRDYVLGKEMYRGKIVSPDGKIALIVVRPGSGEDRISVAKKIKRMTLEETKSYPDLKVYFSGLPMQMIEVNRIILRDMLRLIPFVSIVVMVVLFLGMHNFRGVFLPLMTVVLSVIWTLGLMATFGRPLSIISNIMPVLLIAIGTAYSIHFISRYREEYRNSRKEHVLISTYRGVGIPILLSALTTIAGFISFVGAYLVSVTDFGIFSAAGVFLSLLFSLTLVPALLSYMSPPSARFRTLESGSKVIEKLVEPAAEFVVKNKKSIVTLSLIVIILGVIGATRIRTSVNMLDYFPEKSEIRQSELVFQKNFGGSIPIQILFRGDLKNPLVLEEIFRFEKYLRHLEGVNNPRSLSSLISEENYVMNGVRTIPSDRQQVSSLLLLLEGQDIMSQLVDSKYREGILQARFSRPETEFIIQTVDSIENFIKHNLLTSGTVVGKGNIPDSLRTTVDSILLDRVSEEVVWDIGYRTGKVVDQEEVKRRIKEFTPSGLTDSDRKRLKEELFEYFYNEFDIELSRQTAEAVSSTIAEKAENMDLPVFTDILKRYVPGVDDEEVSYSYETVSSMIEDAIKRSYVRELTSCLLDSEREDSYLVQDVEGDLYQLVDSRVYIPAGMAPGDTIRFTATNNGFLKIYERFHTSLLRSQKQSFLLAFVLVTILVSIQLSSVIGGLAGIFPILLVVAFTFFVMGFAGVPLDNATMMIAAIVIGIGIDYVIHFTSRYRKEISKGLTEDAALKRTLLTTGRAIYLNAFTVGLGFLVLVFAELLPLRTFGWMVAMTMILSALFATTVLPALITMEIKRR